VTSHGVEDVLSEILKNTNFALQVDESTDIKQKKRSCWRSYDLKTKVKSWKFCCCCKELQETAKGQDIFSILSSYLESCGLSWNPECWNLH
jgi:hypothetical protein